MPAVEHAPSYYAASAAACPSRPALSGEQRADIGIIGAGYTGLSAGLHLAEAGFSVAIVEAARVGWGASGRNGGQIVNSYSRDLDVIEARYGATTARALGEMAFEGARIIRERVARYDIACDLKDGGLFAALTLKQLKHLHAQQALWQRYGHAGLTLLDARQVAERVGSGRYVGALHDHSGGHIHPLNLALGQAAAFEGLGGRIFEHSAVLRVSRGAAPVLHTASGALHCQTVIVAGNAYLGALLPELAAKSMPCGSQLVATEPLAERFGEILPGDECVEDGNYLLDYFRLSADRRLLYGGGVIYGARDPAHIERIIRPKLEKTFPQLRGIALEYAWTGNFLLTLSRLPQLGRLDPQIYYSQGCSGHGITYSHLAGRLLAEVVRGQHQRFDAFAALPHHPFPGGRALRVPLTALGAWYYDLRDKLGI